MDEEKFNAVFHVMKGVSTQFANLGMDPSELHHLLLEWQVAMLVQLASPVAVAQLMLNIADTLVDRGNQAVLAPDPEAATCH